MSERPEIRVEWDHLLIPGGFARFAARTVGLRYGATTRETRKAVRRLLEESQGKLEIEPLLAVFREFSNVEIDAKAWEACLQSGLLLDVENVASWMRLRTRARFRFVGTEIPGLEAAFKAPLEAVFGEGCLELGPLAKDEEGSVRVYAEEAPRPKNAPEGRAIPLRVSPYVWFESLLDELEAESSEGSPSVSSEASSESSESSSSTSSASSKASSASRSGYDSDGDDGPLGRDFDSEEE